MYIRIYLEMSYRQIKQGDRRIAEINEHDARWIRERSIRAEIQLGCACQNSVRSGDLGYRLTVAEQHPRLWVQLAPLAERDQTWLRDKWNRLALPRT